MHVRVSTRMTVTPRTPSSSLLRKPQCSGLAFHARQAPVLAPHPGLPGQEKVVVEMA
jgi:hypothetical protein